MGSGVLVRRASSEDGRAIARVHVQSWRETYRGVMSDAMLDDPALLGERERFWTAALTDPQYARNRTAIAEFDGALVGVAMAGPVLDAGTGVAEQLYLLYALSEVHGRGVGAALLEAVLEPNASTGLWVTDPNPRAQAFYRRHGFIAGDAKTVGGVREVRMTRQPAAAAGY